MKSLCLFSFVFCLAATYAAPPAPSQSPSPLPDAKPVPRVQVIPLPDYQASFQLNGKELTRFRFDPKGKRPFWYPIYSTLGPSLVRIGHPHDPVTHRHHYGAWITHASVSGVSHAAGGPGPQAFEGVSFWED